jgi:hypothetical protein
LFIYLEFYRKPALNFEFYFANGGLACWFDEILFNYLFANIGGLPPIPALYFPTWPKYDFCSGFGARLLKLNSFYAIFDDLEECKFETPA